MFIIIVGEYYTLSEGGFTPTPHTTWFQRSLPTRGGTVRRHTIACKSRSTIILTVCCSSQWVFAAAELILLMTTKSLRRRPDRTLVMLLQMSGDVHPNPGPATKYHCPVCARNVTSRGVSYQCNRCSGWVNAKCSGLLNAAQYRSSDWACGPCSTPPPTPSPPPTPTDQKVMTARSTFYSSMQMELAKQTDRTSSRNGEQ